MRFAYFPVLDFEPACKDGELVPEFFPEAFESAIKAVGPAFIVWPVSEVLFMAVDGLLIVDLDGSTDLGGLYLVLFDVVVFIY